MVVKITVVITANLIKNVPSSRGYDVVRHHGANTPVVYIACTVNFKSTPRRHVHTSFANQSTAHHIPRKMNETNISCL